MYWGAHWLFPFWKKPRFTVPGYSKIWPWPRKKRSSYLASKALSTGSACDYSSFSVKGLYGPVRALFACVMVFGAPCHVFGPWYGASCHVVRVAGHGKNPASLFLGWLSWFHKVVFAFGSPGRGRLVRNSSASTWPNRLPRPAHPGRCVLEVVACASPPPVSPLPPLCRQEGRSGLQLPGSPHAPGRACGSLICWSFAGHLLENSGAGRGGYPGINLVSVWYHEPPNEPLQLSRALALVACHQTLFPCSLSKGHCSLRLAYTASLVSLVFEL